MIRVGAGAEKNTSDVTTQISMSEQQLPYTAEEADALMLDAGTESPRYNQAIRKLVKDFGVQMTSRFGGLMSDQSKHAMLTAYQRTIPVAKEDFPNTVYRFGTANTMTLEGHLYRKLIDFVDSLGLDVFSKDVDFNGAQLATGRVSFLKTEDLDKIMAELPKDIREKQNQVTSEEFRKLIFICYVVLPAIHEAVHQGQDLSLPNSLIESSVDYYVSTYIKDQPNVRPVRQMIFKALVDRFGDDAHKLIFNNLIDPQRKKEILNVAKKLEKRQKMK
jgi:hypothetical protein